MKIILHRIFLQPKFYVPSSFWWGCDGCCVWDSAKCVSSADVSAKILRKPLKNSAAAGCSPECRHKYNILATFVTKAMLRDHKMFCLTYQRNELDSDPIIPKAGYMEPEYHNCLWLSTASGYYCLKTSVLSQVHPSNSAVPARDTWHLQHVLLWQCSRWLEIEMNPSFSPGDSGIPQAVITGTGWGQGLEVQW